MTEVFAEKPFTGLTAARQGGVVFGGLPPRSCQLSSVVRPGSAICLLETHAVRSARANFMKKAEAAGCLPVPPPGNPAEPDYLSPARTCRESVTISQRQVHLQDVD
jgi:hypothetical protein